MKICIIDDDNTCHFIARLLITKILVKPDILQFFNGQEAFDFIETWQHNPESLPSIILLDINMPVANGWRFLDMLRQLGNQYRPAIYITSSSQDHRDFSRMQNYDEVKGFLPKPVSKEILEQILIEE
ncbi:Response regulator receiver domain-containing protein [Dyadobacter koreensis]|uniref:Response regulator receiver domain-containing protein n=1 Tax=Dyadobacter koreensis TaxID=408657 RepID=A0A1H6QL96_9BACT|nr:response regulator [Dyadobacter koreensis]SEI41754.1 Response regulator receiver domain-containing protein [Dyadobacter koreensis]